MTDLEMQRDAGVLLLEACSSIARRNRDDGCATRLQKAITVLANSSAPWEKAREHFREETADWPQSDVVTALLNARDMAADESEKGRYANRLLSTLEIVARPEELDCAAKPGTDE